MSRAALLAAGAAVALVVVSMAVVVARTDDTPETSGPPSLTTVTTAPPSTRSTPTSATTTTVATTSTATTVATTSSVAPAPDTDGFAELEITVTTDRPAYVAGQDVVITIRSCSRSDTRYTQRYTSPRYATTIHDEDGTVVADEEWRASFPQVVQEISWEPGECKDNVIRWQQNTGALRSDGSDRRPPGERAPAGTYVAVVEWHAYEGDGPASPKPTITSPPFELR
jgi:hypothetical protein